MNACFPETERRGMSGAMRFAYCALHATFISIPLQKG
jgi:hypothetical protein